MLEQSDATGELPRTAALGSARARVEAAMATHRFC
jgi:hypothetical protein